MKKRVGGPGLAKGWTYSASGTRIKGARKQAFAPSFILSRFFVSRCQISSQAHITQYAPAVE